MSVLQARVVVLVTGGHLYRNEPFVHEALSTLAERVTITCLVQGEAAGADTYGKNWAQQTGIPVEGMPANWADLGDAAGPARNQQMLDTFTPDLVVGFPGGPGTRHMLKIARKAGVAVWEPNHTPLETFLSQLISDRVAA